MTDAATSECHVEPTSAATLAAHTPTDRNRAVDFYRAAAMAHGGRRSLGGHGGRDRQRKAGRRQPARLLTLSTVGSPGSARSCRCSSSSAGSLRPHRCAPPNARASGRPTGSPPGCVAWSPPQRRLPASGPSPSPPARSSAGSESSPWERSAAAIPLWFLANYTIDTALAPFTFRWFRRPPAAAGRRAPRVVRASVRWRASPASRTLPQINWVIGWLGFQVAGFAWQDGPSSEGTGPGHPCSDVLGPGDRRGQPRTVARGDAPPRRARATAPPIRPRPH